MSNLLIAPNNPQDGNWSTGLGGGSSNTNFALAPDSTMTAFRLTDADGGNVTNIGQPVAIPADTAQYVLYIWVQKTIAAANFPILDFRYTGNAKLGAIVINTDAGTITPRTGGWTPEYSGIASYDTNYWRAYLGSANNNYTSIDVHISPAFNADASGNFNLGIGGSAIFWSPTLRLGNSPAADYSIAGSVGGVGAISYHFMSRGTRINGSAQAAADITGDIRSAAAQTPLKLPVVSTRTIVARQGVAMTARLAASSNPTAWLVLPLPEGLELNRTTGVVSGTPTGYGTWSATVTAANADGYGPATQVLFDVRPPAPAVATTALPGGTRGTAYPSTAVAATGVYDTVTVSGLPSGMAYSAATGHITGTPTAGGTFAVVITVSGPGGAASATVSLVVAITTWRMVETIRDTYQAPPGGAGTYIASGLPGWLSINGSSGVLSGTPDRGAAGDYDVTLSYNAVQQVVLRVRVTALPAPKAPYETSGRSTGIRSPRALDNSRR